MNTNNPKSSPFEIGTNEYNQQSTNNSAFGNFLGGVPNLAGDSFTEAKPTSSQTMLYEAAPSMRKDPLAFAVTGEAFIKFNRPPEKFIEEESLKTLEMAKKETPQIISDKNVDNLNLVKPFINFEFKETKKEIMSQQAVEERESGSGIFGNLFGFLKDTFSFIFKLTPKFFNPVKEFTQAVASLGPEGFLLKPERQKSKEEIEADKKEAKKVENKKVFFGKLAELTRQMPISEGLRTEMIATNQGNGFTEEYEGVLERHSGITTYHSTNRRKKEAEVKAAKIAQERVSKIQSATKKSQGFGQRAGEMLMGTENPSHFTKTLG